METKDKKLTPKEIKKLHKEKVKKVKNNDQVLK